MKEFINKLIERLSNEYLKYNDGDWNSAIDRSIEIVNQLAEEYAKDTYVQTIDVTELVEKKAHTNAYRIRAMSDEELADYLYKMTLASLTVVEVDSREIAIPKLLKWLQSEAE